MKILAIYSAESFSLKLKIFFYKLLGYQPYYRVTQQKTPSKSTIPFPESRYYCQVAYGARDRLKNYCDKYLKKQARDIYVLDYIRFAIVSDYVNYEAFRLSTTQLFQDSKSIIFITPFFYDRIYEDRSPFSFLNYIKNIIPYVLAFIEAKLKMLKSIVYCFLTRQSENVPKVMFLRKKVYPDLSISTKLIQLINSKGVDAKAAFFLFSRAREKHGFLFLNTFKGIKKATIKALFQSQLDTLRDLHLFLSNGLSSNLFAKFSKDSFTSHSVLNLGAKTFVGVLHDKAIYILFYRNKNQNQKMASINECFYYPPFRGFDYCHLDIYYSMNDIDASIQNVCGGNIKESKNVDFFRRSLTTTSNGVSKDLQELVNRYDFSTILAPIQSPEHLYFQWGPKELQDFLLASLKLAQQNPDTLFILKGKKGELRAMSDSYFQQCSNLENMYVIHSDVPRELKYNQFEDLLHIANLLISMAHTSTTVWQAISNDIPAIGINDAHAPSFLRDFPHIETTSDDLQASFYFWRHEFKKSEWSNFKKSLNEVVNIGSGNGLEHVAKDIVNRFS